MRQISKRDAYFSIQCSILLFTVMLLIGALYLQYMKDLQPCPLCMMQRIAAIGLFFTTLVNLYSISNVTAAARRLGEESGMALYKSQVKCRLFSIIQFFWIVIGLFLAGRQIWMQSLPTDAVPACMPGLDILLTYFSWLDVLKALFLGGGECAHDSFRLLGLSLPHWSFIYFTLMALLVGMAWMRRDVRI